MKYENEINDILRHIEKVDIVSFDIFDTLLLRNVCNPTDIFKIVEVEYYKKFNKKVDFFKLRILAENKARDISEFEDICFDDIYKLIEKKIGKEQSDILRKLEIECELKFIISNEGLKRVFLHAKQLGKEILIISDMYLDSDILCEFLRLNGYSGYYKLYVSSQIKKTKATGSIYSYIRQDLKINEKTKWIHIGDNYTSDVINSKENGIKSIYYRRLSDRFEIKKIRNLSESILQSIIVNMIFNNNDNYWVFFGIKNVSPIYVGLMFDLVDKLKNKENIFFLSRDGYLPYKLYKIIKEKIDDLPEGKYLYASRRAYVYPSICDNKEKIIDLIVKSNEKNDEKKTINDVFKNFNIDITLYKDKLNEYGLTANDMINHSNIDSAKKIVEDLWIKIKENLNNEKKMLVEYLKQEGIMKFRDVNIFDIGWSGSTQKAISKLVGRNVYGFYFGTAESIDKDIKNKTYGYIFNKGLPIKKRNIILNNVMIYELLFTAPHGSLKRFIKDNNGIIVPELMELQSDYMYKCIEDFQYGVIRVFKETLKYFDYFKEDLSKDFVLANINNFLDEKNILDMCEFEKITNTISIGESGDKKLYVTSVEFSEYTNNIKKYNEIAERSLWKDAMIIIDNQNRKLNISEFSKLYNINNNTQNIMRYINYIVIILKKVVSNPKKYFYRFILLLSSKLKINNNSK